MRCSQGQTPKKQEQKQLVCTFEPGSTVVLRNGAGRLGRIVCKSAAGAYDWLVAWEMTNLQTFELESNLQIALQFSAEAVTRRPAARAIASIRAQRPARQLAIVAPAPAPHRREKRA